jgi:hypothetical protein
MNESLRLKERNEDQRDLRTVASLHAIDSGLLKWMGGILTAILGFLAITVFYDHSTLTAIAQWQTDKGTLIDQDHQTIQNINEYIQRRQSTTQADTTDLKS